MSSFKSRLIKLILPHLSATTAEILPFSHPATLKTGDRSSLMSLPQAPASLTHLPSKKAIAPATIAPAAPQ
ncbi:hypothetical protein QUA35_19790 [Microcoleus sp. N9_B2]|uniref:hypothetical protein n=1 Tax=unclassified Microcoleus TaxID=2642155 RepID=UPI002FD28F06